MFDDLVYVCDLCGGSPKCVDACTEGAITYIPQKDTEKVKETSLAEIKKETKKMTGSEKRAFYIRRA
jgi:Na+-translocating ferredoxin:NAD+ oxidoreductase RNF subunit RnfB